MLTEYHRRKRWLFTGFLSLFALSHFAAAGQQLYLKHFTVDEGLPSNEVYQVGEDQRGNLLIATDRGAARYDGYSVSSISAADGTTVMPVYHLYKSPQGVIYFSGLKGKILTYANERLVPLHNSPNLQWRRPAGMLIANTLANHNDSLWISYNNDYPADLEIGTSVVLPNGKAQHLAQPEGIHFDLPRQFFYREFKSRTWPPPERQAVHITWEDGSRSTDSVSLSWFASYVRRLYAVKQNGYTAFCIGRVVMVYKNKQLVSSRSLPKDVLSFTLLSNGTIGVGTMLGGFAFYRINNGAFEGPFSEQLPNLSVTHVYEDRQKGLWFATLEDGLYYAYPARTVYVEQEPKIRYIDSGGNKLVVGYVSGRVATYENSRLLTTTEVPLQPNEFLLRVSFQPNGALVVLASNGYYLQEGKGWRRVPQQNLHLIPVHEKLVYGTSISWPELHAYEGFGGRLLKTVKLPNRVIAAFNDSANTLWLGTWGGLYQYRGDSLIDCRGKHPAFGERIVGIGALPSGWMAVATLGGGLVLERNGRMVALTANNGLPSAIINSLRVSGNSVYLGTNKGITAVSMQDDGKPMVSHFAREAGLPTLDVHQFALAGGQLYGKWVNRLFQFSVAALQGQRVPLAVYLQGVEVNGQPVGTEPGLGFDHQQNSFVFRYNSVNLSGANQQTYAYRLEGFDTEEHFTQERMATYTNLPPGRYAFTVRVMDCSRQGSPKQVFRFTIHPAFWQTGLFHWLVGAALLGLGYGLFRLQLHVAKQKHRLHLRLAESNQRALIQLINPHFISNLLNTVHAAVLKGNKIEAASVISRFAKLMRLTMEVGKEKFVRLEKELELMREYLTLEAVRAPDKFDFAIHLGPDVRPERIMVPGMLIQPFVENAVKHGVMHLPHKGQIVLSLSLNGSSLLCRIEDNGIGVDNARRINANKLATHQSAGISITVNRLMLLHQESKGQFVYEVEKKNPGDNRFPGTVVSFSLPFKYAT